MVFHLGRCKVNSISKGNLVLLSVILHLIYLQQSGCRFIRHFKALMLYQFCSKILLIFLAINVFSHFLSVQVIAISKKGAGKMSHCLNHQVLLL